MPFKGAFQTTLCGSLIRTLSGRRFLKYPDELDFPKRYTAEKTAKTVEEKRGSRTGQGQSESEETVVNGGEENQTLQAGKTENATVEGGNQEARPKSQAPEEVEKGDDPNLVGWYSDDDQENPHNWSTGYKCFVSIQLSVLTFSVYIGSAIYSSGVAGPNSVMEVFGVTETSALVGLTVFVLGYGVGPLLWTPLSEFPQFGRLSIYMATLFIFVALQFPTIYANNIHTLLAMRFLAGFFGSPALATGGASMGDMFTPKHLAYAIGVWGCGAVCGPVIGPLLGGFVFEANGWQWPLWVLTWLSGGCFVFLFFFFPETSGKNILHRRMVRIRRATGNQDLKTQAEIDSADMTAGKIAQMILIRPFQLLFEPILLIFNIYLALIYGLLYLWFESFPLVFQGVHGFSSGKSGLAFLGIFVGAWLSCGVFCIYVRIKLEPIFDKNGGLIPYPEIRLYPAPIAAFCIPIAMFGFGWTGAYASVHWIVPIIMTSFFGIGAFILFQTIFAYFGDAYYTELGAVLTLNDLFRSTWGAAFPLFAGAMFSRLGIAGGNSLVGGLAVLFIPAPFLFIK
ncbi:MFS transporter, DHA1 family, multidrug resistance protein, partial [Tremellales sp. Uapishka_1]